MSVYIDLKNLSKDFDEKLMDDLIITPKESKYGQSPEMECYDIFIQKDKKKIITIPMNYFYKNEKNICTKKIIKKKYPHHSGYKFKGSLINDQPTSRDKALKKLNKYKTLLLSVCTGGGKTVLGIYLLYKMGLKACVLVHRKFLIDQWVDRIGQFAPNAIVQILHTRTKMRDDADIFLMNIDNVHKKEYGFFDDIGVLVIDEAHLSCSPGRIKAYYKFCPKYLLCLTATPFERKDTLDIQIFGLYVGEKSQVHKPLWREHNVYKYDTNIFTPLKFARGNIDWGEMLQQQASNVNRNDLIIDIIKFFPTINFIVLCKRILQAKYLYKHLSSTEDVDIYTGEHKYFNFNTRILISSFSKTGTGFDWVPRTQDGQPMNMGLIIASDVESYFLQYLGRVFRSDKSPIVVDLVDKFASFQNHWKTRSDVYTSVGGQIQDFKEAFPKFSKS